MNAGTGVLLLAVFSAFLSLCVSIEQVFYEPIPTLNFVWAECSLWGISFVLIGIGVILGQEIKIKRYIYEYSGEEIVIEAEECATAGERFRMVRRKVLKKYNRFNKRSLIYKGEVDCKQ